MLTLTLAVNIKFAVSAEVRLCINWRQSNQAAGQPE